MGPAFCAVTLLLLCVLGVCLWRVASPRAVPSGGSGLLLVPCRAVREWRASHGGSPWLVQGLPRTPHLARWRRAWGVASVRLLCSPSGVFGAYGDCEDQVQQEEGERLGFRTALCARDPLCRPLHVARAVSPEEAARWLALPPAERAAAGAARHLYARGAAGAGARRRLRRRTGWPDLATVSPYLSEAGCVTNLHLDKRPGVLAQTAGVKRVALFAPGTMPWPAPEDSPCARRSYQDTRVCAPGAALTLELRAGRGLYIPEGWAHHVESLSTPTLGAVWRF